MVLRASRRGVPPGGIEIRAKYRAWVKGIIANQATDSSVRHADKLLQSTDGMIPALELR